MKITGEKVIEMVGGTLEAMVSKSHQIKSTRALTRRTKFYAERAPTISLRGYAARILKYAPCSAECFITALIYIKRVVDVHGWELISGHTVHRMLITSVLISSKYLDDVFYNNTYYAKVGGVSAREMNKLELELLFLLNFQLNIESDEYQHHAFPLLAPVVDLGALPLLRHSSSWTTPKLAATKLESVSTEVVAVALPTSRRRPEQENENDDREEKEKGESCDQEQEAEKEKEEEQVQHHSHQQQQQQQQQQMRAVVACC
jgi:Cyclin